MKDDELNVNNNSEDSMPTDSPENTSENDLKTDTVPPTNISPTNIDETDNSPESVADTGENNEDREEKKADTVPPNPAENPTIPPHNPIKENNVNDTSFALPNWYRDPQTAQPAGAGFTPPPEMTNKRPPRPVEKRDKRVTFWLRIVAILLVILLGYCIGSDIYLYRSGNTTTITSDTNSVTRQVVIEQQSKPEGTSLETDADGKYTVEGVAAAVRPSIVEIYTFLDADTTTAYGSGSGIIISEDGYIITNTHVLTDANYFIAITDDGEQYPVEVVGSDTKTDLAVIHINATGLTPAILGDSDEVVLGEEVVAIGNPAGLSGSVTCGIVSGLNRQIRAEDTGLDMDCIQTDAAISPGNSGGALVNMYGQVIGITSSKYVSTSYEGLGFAITINEVLPIVEDIIENGYVSGRVKVGIVFSSLTWEVIQDSFCEEIGLKDYPSDLMGIWIVEIDPECDIAQSGLEVNDVIISMNGEEVEDYDSVCAAIEGYGAGDIVEAVCRRYNSKGQYVEFTIEFALMEDTSGDY